MHRRAVPWLLLAATMILAGGFATLGALASPSGADLAIDNGVTATSEVGSYTAELVFLGASFSPRHPLHIGKPTAYARISLRRGHLYLFGGCTVRRRRVTTEAARAMSRLFAVFSNTPMWRSAGPGTYREPHDVAVTPVHGRFWTRTDRAVLRPRSVKLQNGFAVAMVFTDTMSYPTATPGGFVPSSIVEVEGVEFTEINGSPVRGERPLRGQVRCVH